MKDNPLLYGIIGFLLGGLLVSVAATTFDKPSSAEMPMSQMTEELRLKKGDAYDKAFLSYMIEHHKAAVDMALLASTRAKHDDIRQMSTNIVEAQQKEIRDMILWQTQWGYMDQNGMNMSH